MQKIAGKCTFDISRMRIGELFEPVDFVLKNRIDETVASARLSFVVSDEATTGICGNIYYDPQYSDTTETLGKLLLSVKHWCQANDIRCAIATDDRARARLYRNYGFETDTGGNIQLLAAE